MPARIKTLAPKLPELGRIRLGAEKTDPRRPGTPLTTYRITAQSREVIDTIAGVYGGAVKPWQSPAGNEWQVIITAKELVVRLVPGGYSQAYELWAGAVCQRRCDGERAFISRKTPDGAEMIEEDCACDPLKRECKPKSRLSVLIKGVYTLGAFRLETNSLFFAMEARAMVELAEAANREGRYLEATLAIEDRKIVKAGGEGKQAQTARFKVPVLRLHDSEGMMRRLDGVAEPLRIGSVQPQIAAPEDYREAPAVLERGTGRLL